MRMGRKVSVLFAANRQMTMAAEARPLWLHLSKMCGGGTPNGVNAMFLLHFPTTAVSFRQVALMRISASKSKNWEMTRSEEHTSELQSIMRNSYADVGLKKKTNTNIVAQNN